MEAQTVREIRKYISENWLLCVHRANESPGTFDMPFPFSSPSHEGQFSRFFYWDTYFINNGLIRDGFLEQAKNNLNNIVYLIDKFGYVPNIAIEGGESRSQLPVFSLMCDEYYRVTEDKEFLEECFPRMEREYFFWMKNRVLPSGLNRFGNCCDNPEGFRVFYQLAYCPRVYRREPTEAEMADEKVCRAGSQALSEAESGWDFTPRFSADVENCAAIDLNSLLYANELILDRFAKLLGERRDYAERAEVRKKKIIRYCYDGRIFRDYNERTGNRTELVTAASFFPYAFGISGDVRSLRFVLEKLEYAHGISTVEKSENQGTYQWNYPNLWPPLQFFAVRAMLAIGDDGDARRVMEKYVCDVSEEYRRTGFIWEKYEVLQGRKAELNEYREESMMGWSAATFSYFIDELRKYAEGADFRTEREEECKAEYLRII